MPKLNPYYIKNIEKLPKTEEIIHLNQNYQPQSYEEFVKTYEPNEEVEILTEAEWQDRVLNGSQYGPGNEQSKTAAKELGGAALTGLTVVCPPAGAVVGGSVAGAGAFVAAVGKSEGDKETTTAGLEMMGMGLGAFSGGVAGKNAHSGKNCFLPICPKK